MHIFTFSQNLQMLMSTVSVLCMLITCLQYTITAQYRMTSLGLPALQSYFPCQHQLQAVILRDSSYIILLQFDGRAAAT